MKFEAVSRIFLIKVLISSMKLFIIFGLEEMTNLKHKAATYE